MNELYPTLPSIKINLSLSVLIILLITIDIYRSRYLFVTHLIELPAVMVFEYFSLVEAERGLSRLGHVAILLSPVNLASSHNCHTRMISVSLMFYHSIFISLFNVEFVLFRSFIK